MYEKIYEDITMKLHSNETVYSLTILDNDNKKVENKISGNMNYIISFISDTDVKNNITEKSIFKKPLKFLSENKTYIIEPFHPKPRLIILGGGHIAKPLCQLASNSNFNVIVVDDRPFFANKNRFPLAYDVFCESFENIFSKLEVNEKDYVVIVTRGHKHDGICIKNALNHELAYLGMIGSKRRVKDMMDSLLYEGYSQSLLDKVYSPIGLNIGAVTPYEIAISIIAELISVKYLKNNSYNEFSEFDEDVIEKLKSKNNDIAIATIISSKGSVPRKSGSKMIINSDGTVFGSIGGGCSEGTVILKALDLIKDKGYLFINVDMTGEMAESEGMICGGIIEVLVESY